MPSILVVEDDPKTSALVRLYLANAGFEVEVAADGRRALAAARERPPDLDRARRDAPRHRRPRGLPRPAGGVRGSGDPAHRPHHRGGPAPRARPRGGRLRQQAVQPARAGGAGAGGAAAERSARACRGLAAAAVPRLAARPCPARGRGGGQAGPPHAQRAPAARGARRRAGPHLQPVGAGRARVRLGLRGDGAHGRRPRQEPPPR